MPVRKLAALAALGLVGAFVACTLNPQPLPPSDEASSFGDDAGSRADANGVFSPGTADAASPTVPNDNDGGAGSGDAGDGGDGGSDAGGDAGGDASDGGDAG